MTDTQTMIETLSKAVSWLYPGKCAPSVIISFLPNKEWYVSVIKYEDSYEDKNVMHKARNKILSVALADIGSQLLNSVVRDTTPLDDLDQLMNPRY